MNRAGKRKDLDVDVIPVREVKLDDIVSTPNMQTAGFELAMAPRHLPEIGEVYLDDIEKIGRTTNTPAFNAT